MRQIYCIVVFLLVWQCGAGQISYRYELNESLTYEEVNDAYGALAETCLSCSYAIAGNSDSGRPIFVFSAGDPQRDVPTLMINNGIHPGESCGVDASVLLMDSLLNNSPELLDKVNVVIISLYNVGGSIHRGCCTRANQNGPTEQGFRGNARHLDLNRDFIKMDSKNARTFAEVFHKWEPEIFVDTHTSNGADYQHYMTLIHSQLDMISPDLAQVSKESLIPHVYREMEAHYPMVPYMDMLGETPEEGIKDFADWPRYSNGYVGLFNCIGFTTEAHMLKPYTDRVKATYHFLDIVLRYCASDAGLALINAKKKAEDADRTTRHWAVDYEVDMSKPDSVMFHGYHWTKEQSRVTGLDRLKYHQDRPFSKMIPHFQHYAATDTISAPRYYVISQAWSEVIERLELNEIEFRSMPRDTSIDVRAYYVTDLRSPEMPYEGHYLHSGVETRAETQRVNFLKGDILIPTNQKGKRYLIHVLEPRAKDSFFAWNFFDAHLQQKEWFSPYVFEDMAEDILKENPQLKAKFEEKKTEDDAFRSSMWDQLLFIYRHSRYYEKSHMRVPVFRID